MLAALELDFAKVAFEIENSIGQSLLALQRGKHSMLDSVFGDQVDYRDVASLMLAPRARNPLLQFGGIPRQVAIHHDARILEVQSRRSRIGAEEEAALKIGFEKVDLGASPFLGYGAGMPGEAEIHSAGQAGDELEHALPF
ncbi:hypothetical protein SDC9_139297 [bioreactor metagenome]|uniref:Uncharacterized protein n=1 Tax=bioreactor metagenome TaxID=1076179 RepID=A0A645DUZ1_9ZZZZ